MKAVETGSGEQNNDAAESPPRIEGDVIGDTAYSERFVLKLMLKFANLDSLQDEIEQKSFEEDLCTLWDMTIENDVVKFLLQHKIDNLFLYAIPVIKSSRITEIIIGILGNMCCQKEGVDMLLNNTELLLKVLEFFKSDDSLVLIQVLRLMNSSLFVSDSENLRTWIETFEKNEYSTTLYFMLTNSLHKDLLVNCMENLNTLFTYCNTEDNRKQFYDMFISTDGMKALNSGFTEIYTQKDECDSEELERIFFIYLQSALNFLGFENAEENFFSEREEISTQLKIIMDYYEYKIVDQKDIDTDIVDIIESISILCDLLKLPSLCEPNTFAEQSFEIWKLSNTYEESKDDFEGQDLLKKFQEKTVQQISTLLCKYMAMCSDINLLDFYKTIELNEENIIRYVQDEKLKESVKDRIQIVVSSVNDH